MNRLSRPIVVLIGLLLAALPAMTARAAAVCEPARYEVLGSVVGADGAPLPGATVYLLVDKISKKEFLRHMVRAEWRTTDDSGRFRAEIDCEGYFLRGDFPRPCRRGVGKLTVGVRIPSGRLQVKTYSLGALKRSDTPDDCVLQLPPLRFK